MNNLSANQRAGIILNYAQTLMDNMKPILEANRLDIELATKNSECNLLNDQITSNEKCSEI